ncbi:DMT family transporter [Halobacillus mangrovi]|uniref:DMT family transporter n=1 Tax=Halobacillus mangrovi TaxID=402384 RepID=UPI001E60D1CB|nr:SMR family transporter [Halobacillus mangrovi]
MILGYLILSLLFATLGNICVKLSSGFRRFLPSTASFGFIGLCLYFLTLSVETLEIWIAYAVWSGVSIAATTLFGIFLFNEEASRKKFISIGLIIIGVIIL